MDRMDWTRPNWRCDSEPADPSPEEKLVYDDEVKAETDHLYDRVKDVILPEEWPAHAPLIAAINRLKKERGAIILAHNYMTPEIFSCVGDLSGDSLALARMAADVEEDIIVQAGVHFMAETAKIMCPDKTVLIPDMRAGCSLAESITGEDVAAIKAKYPHLPIVTYVNTSAAVKAEADVCCTSGNAVQVVEWAAKEWNTDTVILIPDEFLAKNVAANTDIRILTWKGACEVHERFTAEDVEALREGHPGVVVLTHPESPSDVVAAADYAGSTAGMAAYVKNNQPAKVVLLTECSMSDNVAIENPGVKFVRPCNLCPHMKRITLQNIYDALRYNQYEVEVDENVAERARVSIQRMLDLPKPDSPAMFNKDRPAVEVELV
ncbi:quinolinate synthase NadA [Hyphobacterium sp.]|uniref:quinolinate synthase NadA n=1 Tax=Hyphobacterium sp. TaxID=2004662 RepID=UPI00374909A2